MKPIVLALGCTYGLPFSRHIYNHSDPVRSVATTALPGATEITATDLAKLQAKQAKFERRAARNLRLKS